VGGLHLSVSGAITSREEKYHHLELRVQQAQCALQRLDGEKRDKHTVLHGIEEVQAKGQ